MKKILAVMLCLVQLLSLAGGPVLAAETYDVDFWGSVSEMINKYYSDDYFSTMKVTIGESEIMIDGETVPIDESNSVPYVENGRTMMPLRGIAEAIGAEVDFDGRTQTVKVENNENTIKLTIGENQMEINGESVTLRTAPKLLNDRTMLPVRDVAEALDCEVSWDEETQTATFTRPLQTKRLIALSENADTTGAVMSVKGNGMTIMQFATIDETQKAIERNEKLGIYTEPDYVRESSALSWGISDIGSQSYHNQTGYAAGSAVVAVIDSGIDYSHPYFSGKIQGGYDIVNNDSRPEDQNGHGTHVSSTVIDVAGYNSNIKIMPVKVFGKSDTTYTTTIVAGVEYAVEHDADVINMSLGGEGYSQIETNAVNKALNKNIAVVVAAGNEKYDLTKRYCTPACIDGVITVSAATKSGKLAWFSNYGEGIVDFAAPGENIKGAKLGGGYVSWDGTSMATPHVAGVYALAKAVHPNMPVEDITRALKKNAISKGNSAKFGAGMIRINNLESHLSRVFTSEIEVNDVTETNATISTYISYDGIRPETVGVRVYEGSGSKDIYSTKFVDNGYGRMNLVCNLKKQGYELKPGTVYKMAVLMKVAGVDYVSDHVYFNTKNETTPPAASQIAISPTAYPKGEMKKGSTFSLKGKITSNYNIKEVRSYILDENKHTVQEASDIGSSKTYVIDSSKLDTGLKFEKLTPGVYSVKYYATDSSGKSIEWTSGKFTVAEEKTVVPDKSTLTISPTSYPSGEFQQGSSFSLKGKITSNYHITDVRSYILDANKNVVQESSGWTTTKTYVIDSSKLDTGLKFGNLSPGKYYLMYSASDESGKTVKWQSDSFTVKAKESESSNSTLKIAPTAYPQGSMKKGSKYALKGKITSNHHITDVRSYILDANKNVVQESSGWTTTKTYVIDSSKLDTGLKFEKLSEGTYYLKYSASDESGKSVSWTSNAFSITGNGNGNDNGNGNGSKGALVINPTAYPQGEIAYGKSFTLTGKITSDCHITAVRAYILDANKNVVMSASGWTTTQTYVIKSSALDKGMKFNKLSTGGYYLRYEAEDEKGNSVSWTSNMFYVK